MHHSLEHCGYVTLTGRPNVGKSTLLNRLIGQKLSITSRKPQTTRSHLLGIKNTPQNQIIYIDTPGLQSRTENLMNRHMNREVFSSLSDCDVVVHVVEALKWTPGDIHVQQVILKHKAPRLLAINKIDQVGEREQLLPYINKLNESGCYQEIIPVSARHGDGVDTLETCIAGLLPEGPAIFDDDQITDKSEKYFAAEFIREKLTRKLGDEIPYSISVTIDSFKDEKNILRIHATIWVASHGQKKIVVGKNGAVLKKAGQEARHDMENLFGKKVFLETWVKIKDQWMANPQIMRTFGYE